LIRFTRHDITARLHHAVADVILFLRATPLSPHIAAPFSAWFAASPPIVFSSRYCVASAHAPRRSSRQIDEFDIDDILLFFDTIIRSDIIRHTLNLHLRIIAFTLAAYIIIYATLFSLLFRLKFRRFHIDI
jgi:hypothetical protein